MEPREPDPSMYQIPDQTSSRPSSTPRTSHHSGIPGVGLPTFPSTSGYQPESSAWRGRSIRTTGAGPARLGGSRRLRRRAGAPVPSVKPASTATVHDEHPNLSHAPASPWRRCTTQGPRSGISPPIQARAICNALPRPQHHQPTSFRQQLRPTRPQRATAPRPGPGPATDATRPAPGRRDAARRCGSTSRATVLAGPPPACRRSPAPPQRPSITGERVRPTPFDQPSPAGVGTTPRQPRRRLRSRCVCFQVAPPTTIHPRPRPVPQPAYRRFASADTAPTPPVGTLRATPAIRSLRHSGARRRIASRPSGPKPAAAGVALGASQEQRSDAAAINESPAMSTSRCRDPRAPAGLASSPAALR